VLLGFSPLLGQLLLSERSADMSATTPCGDSVHRKGAIIGIDDVMLLDATAGFTWEGKSATSRKSRNGIRWKG